MTDTQITSVVNTPSSEIATKTFVAATYEPKKGSDDNYVTDAEKIVIGNTSGTNTGDQRSIPRTTTFSKTWTTGMSPYIKTKQVFLANASFVRVYKDNVLLTYSSDWSFNITVGKKLGSVADLTDGVQIVSPVNGAVYRVEFDEYIVPFNPRIALYRADNKMFSRGLPRNTISGDGGKSGLISNIAYDSGDEYSDQIISYTTPNTFTLPFYNPNLACCIDYAKGVALPTNWRIEVYKQGRHWTGTRKSNSGTYQETMNSCLSPRVVYTTNEFSLGFTIDKKRTGRFKIRLRNTVTNEVSLFSIQTIKTRRFRYLDRSWNPIGVQFVKISLD